MNLALKEMIQAAEEIIEFQRVLANTGDNVVSDLLRFSDKFVEWDHYPDDDVKDQISGGQYYYHAHPNSKRGFVEHGHFHVFLKNTNIPTADTLPLTHIIAISMDDCGAPRALFTVNHWVTGGIWENASTVEAFLDTFIIDHAKPSWVVNCWVNSMLKLYKPEIIKLIRERDLVIADYRKEHPGQNVFELRDLEIPSYLPISIESKLLALKDIENKEIII